MKAAVLCHCQAAIVALPLQQERRAALLPEARAPWPSRGDGRPRKADTATASQRQDFCGGWLVAPKRRALPASCRSIPACWAISASIRPEPPRGSAGIMKGS